MYTDLEWKWIEKERFCLAGDVDGLPDDILETQNTTPVPSTLLINGKSYYPELFHADSLPSECEDLE